MNRPLNIVDALKGKQSPIAHLRWHLVCPTCARDLGYCNGYPVTVNCHECESPVEYLDNPEYVAPVSRMTLQRAE